MANVTITGLAAAAALTGTEVLAIDQSGSTVKTTVQDVANLGGGTPPLDIVTVGTLGTTPLTVLYTTVAIVSPAAGTQSASVISYPSVIIGGGMGFSGTLSSITFPTLTAGTFNIQGITTLTSISLPALTTTFAGMMGGGLSFANNSSLTTINIPALVNMPNNSNMSWYGCAFSQATVDHILVRFVATNAINCSIDLSSGTSAAPSATGLAAKATLQGRGWSVTTN